MAFPYLNISPSQLEFLFDADQELKSTLTFRGCQEGVRIAFKIKITNSDRFFVCPPYGIVEPESTRFVRVYMKAPSRYEDSLKYCQDRFLVQSIQVDEDFDEKDITSNLFRSRDRQELKMKVVVSAPLAHSTILENEIRAIADRQGVEGHRAVLRKFAELLLAKGVISQSQVALAFSAVGEIFQNMHAASRENAEEQEKSFQRFLQRGVSDNGRGGQSDVSQLLPKQYSSFMAADYRPSNLPSRQSAPARNVAPSLQPMYSAVDRSSRNDDTALPRNGGAELRQTASVGGTRSNLSTESSETYVPEERRSTAHPAVTRLNLPSVSQARPAHEDFVPDRNTLEEAERPEELAPSAYEAFAPSPDDPRFHQNAEDPNQQPKSFGQSGQPVASSDRQQKAEDPQLQEWMAARRQRDDAQPLEQAEPPAQVPEASLKSAKSMQKPGTDSLGRDFSMTIDRLATPAIRKQKNPQNSRPVNAKLGDQSENSSPRVTRSKEALSDHNGEHGSLTDSSEGLPPGNVKRGVFIPSGNTMQKVNMFKQ